MAGKANLSTPEQQRYSAGSRPSILIVDDNASQCKTMSLILRHKGYTVATANDGPEAIKTVRERPFDVIFMDIKMPLMNGVETYRRIKEVQPKALVIMMTAYAVEDLVQQAMEEGAYGIVYKPLDIERAITIVEEAKHIHQGALILVVDDDRGICITLRSILASRGHEVGIALSGDEAIAMAQQRAYDILFIDMKLPVLNGLETYLAIREINPQAVAIMMTAYRQETANLVEEALRSQAYTCFYKPLDIEELLGLVEEIQARQRDVKRDP
jgi:DNA-binding NtrC family response regulator